MLHGQLVDIIYAVTMIKIIILTVTYVYRMQHNIRKE